MTDVSIVCYAPQLLECSVNLWDSPNPEAVLFDKLSQWLAEQPVRYPILGVNIYYESANDNVYLLVTLGTERPLEE